jgi:hypothetical protein
MSNIFMLLTNFVIFSPLITVRKMKMEMQRLVLVLFVQ